MMKSTSLYLCLLLPICFFQYGTSRIGEAHEKNTLAFNFNNNFAIRRMIRSPFTPPVVTALKPESRIVNKDEKPLDQIAVIVDHLEPPIVINQSKIPRKNPMENQPLRTLGSEHRFTGENSLTPIISNKENLYKNQQAQQLVLRLQNDQSVSNVPRRNKKLRHADEPRTRSRKSSRFRDYNHLLASINKTYPQVNQLLNKKNITLNYFLDFIQKGKTVDEILEYLSKEGEENKVKEDARLTKNKHLESLPKIKETSSPSNIIVRPQKNLDHSSVYHQDSIYAYPPPKDSPMITHFRPAKKRKIVENHTSAEILTLTPEVPKIDKPKKISKHNLYTRNKLIASRTGDAHSNVVIDSNRKNDKEFRSAYQELGLVFPMKGIIIFFGVLVAIAIVLILILSIYSTIKCSKQKPCRVANNYQVSERIELTSAQCE